MRLVRCLGEGRGPLCNFETEPGEGRRRGGSEGRGQPVRCGQEEGDNLEVQELKKALCDTSFK